MFGASSFDVGVLPHRVIGSPRRGTCKGGAAGIRTPRRCAVSSVRLVSPERSVSDNYAPKSRLFLRRDRSTVRKFASAVVDVCAGTMLVFGHALLIRVRHSPLRGLARSPGSGLGAVPGYGAVPNYPCIRCRPGFRSRVAPAVSAAG